MAIQNLQRCDAARVPLSFCTVGVLAILISTGCGQSMPDKVTAESSKYEAADDENDDGGQGDDRSNSGGVFEQDDLGVAVTGGTDAGQGTPPSVGSGGFPRDPFAGGQATGATELLQVPEGPPEELLAFIRKIEQTQPAGFSPEEQIASFQQMMRVRGAAAAKILAQDAPPEIRLQAVFARLDSLEALASTKSPGADQEFLAFAESLLDDEEPDIRTAAVQGKINVLTRGAMAGDPASVQALEVYIESLVDSESDPIRAAAIQAKLTLLGNMVENGLPGALESLREFATSTRDDSYVHIAEMSRITLLSIEAGELVNGEGDDVAAITTQLQELIALGNKSEGVMAVGKMVVMALTRTDHRDEADQAVQWLTEAFRDHANPRLAAQAEQLAEQGDAMALRFAIADAMSGDPEKVEALISALTASFAKGLTVDSLHQAKMSAVNLEESGQPEAAGQVFATIEQHYSGHENPEIARMALDAVAKAELRLDLIGKPLEITGVQLDGSPFDWEAYAGKLVLVDFWASWCRPCLAEFPNIERNYQRYRDQGFEVVGVNMDQAGGNANMIVDRMQLSWTNVMAESAGLDPNAERCGVDMIPFSVLIGPDGIVRATGVHGEKLDAALAAAFDAGDETPAAGSPSIQDSPEADGAPVEPVERVPSEIEP